MNHKSRIVSYIVKLCIAYEYIYEKENEILCHEIFFLLILLKKEYHLNLFIDIKSEFSIQQTPKHITIKLRTIKKRV